MWRCPVARRHRSPTPPLIPGPAGPILLTACQFNRAPTSGVVVARPNLLTACQFNPRACSSGVRGETLSPDERRGVACPNLLTACQFIRVRDQDSRDNHSRRPMCSLPASPPLEFECQLRPYAAIAVAAVVPISGIEAWPGGASTPVPPGCSALTGDLARRRISTSASIRLLHRRVGHAYNGVWRTPQNSPFSASWALR